MPDRSPSFSRGDFEDLLKRARTGDPDSLGSLLDAYRPEFQVLARCQVPSNLTTRVSPSDLIQDMMLTAIRRFSGFQGQTPEELEGWLRQILIHLGRGCRDAHQTALKRSVRCEGRLDEHASPGHADLPAANIISPLDEVIRMEKALSILLSVRELPPNHRDVIQLYFFEHLTIREIGALLGLSDGAVQQRCMRTREALKKLLQHRGILSA